MYKEIARTTMKNRIEKQAKQNRNSIKATRQSGSLEYTFSESAE